MDIAMRIVYLADRTDAATLIAAWFKEEWSDFFSTTTKEALVADFMQRANKEHLPLMLLAIIDNEVAGTVSITHHSITTHKHLGPWISGLYVNKKYRNKGVATQLLSTAEKLALPLGCKQLFAGTSRVNKLFLQFNWQELEVVLYHGEQLSIFRKIFAT